MLETPSPLTERMTLFWHNHFVSSQQKVRSPQLMYRQNVLLRRAGARQLRRAAARGRERSGDGDLSRQRVQPQGPAQRELRARGDGALHPRRGPLQRDATSRKPRAPSPAGASIRDTRRVPCSAGRARRRRRRPCSAAAATSTATRCSTSCWRSRRPPSSSSTKLWREFVSPEPDAGRGQAHRARVPRRRYEIKPLLRAMLPLGGLLRRRDNRAALIKSPVDLVVGTLRQFGFRPADAAAARARVAPLGQNLFSPPNVKGWPGGEAWINSATLLARKQFARAHLPRRRDAGRGDGELRRRGAGRRSRAHEGRRTHGARRGGRASCRALDDDPVRRRALARRSSPVAVLRRRHPGAALARDGEPVNPIPVDLPATRGDAALVARSGVSAEVRCAW